ncbi:hypothetical protein PR202_ga12919 [Eleusine coracana subsp. coracana]|uniref:Bifunctional inhibitor/plant lipid transfer protein/seed storage helical domain-containing protein n=1 Tax=Eleusine coracana subsp. coracana TaxID=191504 RepID=A0AAV5CDD9_ELECO|nr:hypothetical protein PR202_ga12919 [Eleusine coracana subsp. coracana]
MASAQQQQQAVTFPTMPSCPQAPLSLSPCIGYVFGVRSATLDSCCSQLRTFVQAQAPCLCAASKLAPGPVGLLLGQAQGMIPNVCNLPNPCDGISTAATPSGIDTSPPAQVTTPVAPAGGEVPSATMSTPSATPASATPATETSAATTPDDDPDEDLPPVDTAPGQTAPAGTGAKKLPELLHAAGATSSRDTAVGTMMVTLFLASVATIYV